MVESSGMMIREYEPADLMRLRVLNDINGIGFDLPDPTVSDCPVKKVIYDESGIVMAAILRQTTESYLICNRTWGTPAWRKAALELLHAVTLNECREKGIEDTQALISPAIERAFGRRLKELGWGRNDWACYSRKSWEPHELRKAG